MNRIRRLYLEDFGILPDDGQNMAPFLRQAIEEAQALPGPCEISLRFGNYDIYADDLAEKKIFVTNTDSGKDGDEITRRFAVLFDSVQNIILNGNGSTIRFHGQMTLMGLLNCQDITLKNMIFETPHPTLTEMTVIALGKGYLDCRVHPDSRYRIRDGKIEWYGENFAFSRGVSQLYDPKSGLTWREYGPMQDENAVWEESSTGVLRLWYTGDENQNPYGAQVGYVFQMRDPYRNECGILVSSAKGITLKNIVIHYMHEMGFIAQNSENIYIDGLQVLPSRGRTAACSSDILHFSGCRGEIVIENGCFVGAHDDTVNIHGTHLQIMKKEGRCITIRFMHTQTYGIGGFEPGDTVAAVDPDTLLLAAEATVISANELSPREILLELDGESLEAFSEGMMVENRTAAPAVTIRGNTFERVPTRGILVTTWRKVLIEDNRFYRVKMCGILIADDARSWYESGNVTDVTVRGNVYRKGGGAFLQVLPENSLYAGPVHRHIIVTGNDLEFSQGNETVLEARCTDDIAFCDNRLSGFSSICRLSFESCGNICVERNDFTGELIMINQ